MADDTKGPSIGITVTADTNAAVQQLRKLGDVVKEDITATDALGKSQKGLSQEVARASSAQREATEAVRRAKEAQQEAAITARVHGEKSTEAAVAQRRLEVAQKEAAAATKAATTQLEKAAKATTDVATAEGKATPAVKRLERQLQGIGKEAERAAADMRRLDLQVTAAGRSGGGDPFGGIASGLGKVSGFLAAGGLVAGITQLGAAVGAAAERSLKLEAAESALSISIKEAQASTGGLISKYNLMTAANSAVGLGVVKNEQEFAQLAEAATKLALKTGTDVPGAVGNLVTALGRGSTELLDNYGIVMKVADAQKIYAEQIGKTVGDLTEEDKKNAFKVVALQKIKEAADGANVSLDTQTAKLAAMNARWEEFGDRASKASTYVFGAIASAALDATDALTSLDAQTAALMRMDPGNAGARGEKFELGGSTERYVNAAIEAVTQTKEWAGASALLSQALRDQAAAEALARSDEYDQSQVVMGPAAPTKAKRKGGARRKAEAFDDPSEVANARIYRGQYDDIGSMGATQQGRGDGGTGATAAESQAMAAAQAEQRIANIDREIAALEAKGEAEQAEAFIVFDRWDKETALEAERRTLQDERIAREMELANFQARTAETAEQRDAARTAKETAEHNKRILNLQRAQVEEEKVNARKTKALEAVNGHMQQLGGVMLSSIEAQVKGEKGAILEGVSAFAKGIRDRMILMALQETALGIAALAGIATAGLAAPHFAAAGVATAAALAAGGLQAGFHGAAVSAGYGEEKPAAATGAGSAAGGSTGRGSSKQGLQAQDVPITYEQDRRDAGTRRWGRDGSGAIVVVNVHGNVLGEGGKRSFAREMKGILDEHGKRGGQFAPDD